MGLSGGGAEPRPGLASPGAVSFPSQPRQTPKHVTPSQALGGGPSGAWCRKNPQDFISVWPRTRGPGREREGGKQDLHQLCVWGGRAEGGIGAAPCLALEALREGGWGAGRVITIRWREEGSDCIFSPYLEHPLAWALRVLDGQNGLSPAVAKLRAQMTPVRPGSWGDPSSLSSHQGACREKSVQDGYGCACVCARVQAPTRPGVHMCPVSTSMAWSLPSQAST